MSFCYAMNTLMAHSSFVAHLTLSQRSTSPRCAFFNEPSILSLRACPEGVARYVLRSLSLCVCVCVCVCACVNMYVCLFAHLPPPPFRSFQDGWSALHLASGSSHTEVVQRLVVANCDLNAQNHVRCSPSMCCCSYLWSATILVTVSVCV